MAAWEVQGTAPGQANPGAPRAHPCAQTPAPLLHGLRSRCAAGRLPSRGPDGAGWGPLLKSINAIPSEG